MKNLLRWQCLGVASFGLVVTGLTGCQTWTYTSGLTLPSGRYLQHRPQYIPPSPDFPLERELAQMQQQQLAGPGSALAPGGAAPPVPGVPAP